MNRHGGTTSHPIAILRSASNLLCSRDTSITSGRKQLTFRKSSTSKRKALGSAAISLQPISVGFSNGWKMHTTRGSTGSRITGSPSTDQKELGDAGRLAKSRHRHGLRGDSRAPLQRWFI